MSSRKNLVLAPIVILFAFGISVACPVSLGCDCSTLSREQSFRAADLVFVGRVVSIEKEHYREKVNIEVRRSFKGGASGTVSLYQDPSDCNVSFVVSKRYMVFAQLGNGGPFATTCSGTKVLNGRRHGHGHLGMYRLTNHALNRQYSYSQIALITFVSVTLSISIGFVIPKLVRRRWRSRPPEVV